VAFDGSITPVAQYGYRTSRQLGDSLVCVEVIAKAKPGTWKVKFIGGQNPGLVDYVRSAGLVVSWSESEAFLNDERRLKTVIETSDSQWNRDTTVSGAINMVLDSSGDWDSSLSDYGSDSAGTAYVDLDAARRIARRARMDPDPLKLDPVGFVDRKGGLYLTYNASLILAQAFARAEPTTVLMYIDAYEQDFMRRHGDSAYMVKEHIKDKAAHLLAREWTETPEASLRMNHELDELRRSADTSIEKLHQRFKALDQQKTQEIHRLRSLVLEATEILRSAKSEDSADKLLLALNRPVSLKR
jgi:hypothetical protein